MAQLLLQQFTDPLAAAIATAVLSAEVGETTESSNFEYSDSSLTQSSTNKVEDTTREI